jgi:hypothetical protein
LETGETLLKDVAVMHTPPSAVAHHPLPHVKGRLYICSASLVFEPSVDELPLLRIPFSKVRLFLSRMILNHVFVCVVIRERQGSKQLIVHLKMQLTAPLIRERG